MWGCSWAWQGAISQFYNLISNSKKKLTILVNIHKWLCRETKSASQVSHTMLLEVCQKSCYQQKLPWASDGQAVLTPHLRVIGLNHHQKKFSGTQQRGKYHIQPWLGQPESTRSSRASTGTRRIPCTHTPFSILYQIISAKTSILQSYVEKWKVKHMQNHSWHNPVKWHLKKCKLSSPDFKKFKNLAN